MGLMEKQIAGVHGQMASMKGDLHRLGLLEVKVDSMLEKLPLQERMEKMMQTEVGELRKDVVDSLALPLLSPSPEYLQPIHPLSLQK